MAHPIRPSTSLASLLPLMVLWASPVLARADTAPEKPGAATKPAATAPSTKPGTTAPPATTPGPATAPIGEPTPAVDEPTTTETPAETPTDPVPATTPASTVDPATVAALQAEAREIRDALFKARGRVSTVAARLFKTRVSMRLRSNLERFYTVSNLTITMDGAPVYVQASGLPSTDGDLFEVFAAPGSHEIAITVDLVSRRDATYKLRIDHAVGFAVEDDARVSTKLSLRETGNMWRLSRRQRGHSDVRVRLDARSKAGKSSKAARKSPASVGVKGAAK